VKKGKRATREHHRLMKQFVRDAKGTLDCQLLTTEDLLYMTAMVEAGPPTTVMAPTTAAFMQWSASGLKSTLGDGPLCLTCDVEFGPGRTVPAAFWFQSPFAKLSKAVIISGICPACFARSDCMDRIFAGMRRRIPDLRVVPMTGQ
jgi:hypothetical protein